MLFPFFKNKKRKINLSSQLKIIYGSHRSGWNYALSSLKPLHHPKGILLDSFIERTFNWHPQGIRPHLEPWIGVIHVPPNVPKWFFYSQSNESIFQTEAWQQSLPFCRGLFTLSMNHQENLEQILDIPINNLFFATETPSIKWEWGKFKSNPEKKIVQVGWWLRKLHTIYQLKAAKFKKVFLKIDRSDLLAKLMEKEKMFLLKEGVFDEGMYKTVETVNFLPNKEYDRLLAENIVLLNLYDTSANNAIAECIVRNTPILVNPLPAVIEYLGEDYPFYFNSLEEASGKAENYDLIYETHQFLVNHSSKQKLTKEYFLNRFTESEIFKSL
jgi:hypothetical protein